MKKIFICFFTLFSFAILAQEKSNLVYEENIYSVEIQIENGQNYLEAEKDNQFKIITKNIDPVNLRASGYNLRIHKVAENEVLIWVAHPKTDKLIEGKYSLAISFRGKKGKLFTHQFLIPVK